MVQFRPEYSDVLEYQMGLRETARKYGVTHKMIQTWIQICLDKGMIYFQDEIIDEGHTSSDLPLIQPDIETNAPIASRIRAKISKKDEEQLDEDVRKELNRLRR